MITPTTDWRSKAATSLPVPFNRGTAPKKSRPTKPPEVLDAEIIVDVPQTKKARISGVAEPINLSTIVDSERIQSALRIAERGETWQLFTLYRDMVLGYSHLQAEWQKRKMVVVGQPHALVARRQDNPEDEKAAKFISQIIDNCENWMDGMTHLLDATLYPVSVVEKIFRPAEVWEQPELPVRYWLKRFEPVNYTLLCFKLPYSTAGGWGMIGPRGSPSSPATNGASKVDYNPDTWEPDLRMYNTYDNGQVDYNLANAYAPDPLRHVVYRGDMLSRSIRDNFGGQMRSILFWWLLAIKGRDWFGMYMQKYGSPFLVGKADAQNQQTISLLQQAFQLAAQIGGIVIDKRAELELQQASSVDGANGYKTLIDVCDTQVSKIILGQVLSSTTKNTGLGSGVANLHGQVREDIRQFDTMKLNETLRQQLFRPLLRINGYRGEPPDMIWGGIREGAAKLTADMCSSFASAGLRPTTKALGTLSQRLGFALERAPEPAMAGMPKGKKPGANGTSSEDEGSGEDE